MKPMTDEEYVENGAALCPYCRSEYIVAGDHDFGVDRVYQNVTCEDCGKEWTEEFMVYAWEPL